MTKNLPPYIYFVVVDGAPDFCAVTLQSAKEMSEHPEHHGKFFPVHRWKYVDAGKRYVYDKAMKAPDWAEA